MQINYAEINRRALELMLSTKKHLVSVDDQLKALVELRVSQVNGCAYCVDLHTLEARELGVDTQKLDCLTVWKESGLFSKRDRAALGWAEDVTNISTVSDIDRKLKMILREFSEVEVVDLTFVIAVMNSLNRLAISFGDKPAKRSP
ncbi:MAG: carboxymuconolactone decarboxylase family protein [Acidiferrobacterales bacterium]|nr:carboxymuconolactone decarboxylase family protein [Acidiferrobacterales bacterium]